MTTRRHCWSESYGYEPHKLGRAASFLVHDRVHVGGTEPMILRTSLHVKARKRDGSLSFETTVNADTGAQSVHVFVHRRGKKMTVVGEKTFPLTEASPYA